MVIDYQRVKTLIKDFSLKNSFGQIVLFNIFFEKFFFILILMLFLRLLHILSLLLNLLDSLILFEWIFNNLWHHQNNLGSFASTESSIGGVCLKEQSSTNLIFEIFSWLKAFCLGKNTHKNKLCLELLQVSRTRTFWWLHEPQRLWSRQLYGWSPSQCSCPSSL